MLRSGTCPARSLLDRNSPTTSQCGQLNIVKDDWFYCGACDAALPSTWNIDPTPQDG
jgi:hypothetical protein